MEPRFLTFSKASMMMVSRTLMRMKVHDMAKMKNMRAAVVDCAWPEICFLVTNRILKQC